MISRIRLAFPPGSPRVWEFHQALLNLLQLARGARRSGLRLSFRSFYPSGALPELELDLVEGPVVQVILSGAAPFSASVGALLLTNEPSPTAANWQALRPPPFSDKMPAAQMAISRFASSFDGHVLGLDHAGVDLPPELLPRPDWLAMLSAVGQSSALYAYPDGHDWPFIIPASPDEQSGELQYFEAERAPKFELAYDGLRPWPGLHFHLQTNLSQADVEERLPAPYGLYLPGAQTFRSVYVLSAWPGLLVRFDLGFAAPGLNEWDTGRWLASPQRRIR